MKHLICAALVLALCLGGMAAHAEGAPGNRLGLEALRALADGTKNEIISPVSLAYALSMAAQGANGETRETLLSALDAADAGDMAALNDALSAAGLRWANAAFIREDLALNDDYAAALSERFGAEAFPLDAAERVNAWVADRTDGLIERLLETEVDEDVRLMLVNAIAMDAAWAAPFLATDTFEDAFHAPDGDVRADFMHKTLDARYAEIDGTQVIRLDYLADGDQPNGLYMLVALPPEGGVPALLDALAASGLDALEPGNEPCRVLLSLPKLDVSASNGLSATLRALGLELPFSDDADFSGVSAEGLRISEVLQKARVQLDEDGTRAAAATEVSFKANGIAFDAPKPVEMNVNRPFVLLIAEAQTGAIAFAGVVADPTA